MRFAPRRVSTTRQLLGPALIVLAQAAPGLAQCPGVWASGPFSIGNTGTPPGCISIATGLDGSIYATGNFTSAGGSAANRVARWNGLWAPLGSGLNAGTSTGGGYAALIMSNGDLIVGGNINTAGGIATTGIARWNGSVWSALGAGVNGFVYCLASKPNNEIVVGGGFSTAGGGAASNVARWNGSTWIPLGGGVDSSVYAIAVMPNGDIVAGGLFLHAGGNTASYVARFDGSNWLPLTGPAGEGVDDYVYSLLPLPDGSIIVGGRFDNAGGIPAQNIARWSPAGGGTWSAMGAGLGTALNDQVKVVRRLSSGSILAGGIFVTDGTGSGPALNRIARWDGTAWQPIGAGANNIVWTITGTNYQSDTFYAGGPFTTAGGATAIGVAQFNGTATPTITLQPASTTEKCGATARFMTLAAAAPVAYQWRRGGVNLANGPTGAGSTVSGATTPVLTITSVAAADAAAYDCVITMNGGCAAATSAATLTTSGCCPTDFDGNGSINSVDVASYINAWFAALSFGC